MRTVGVYHPSTGNASPPRARAPRVAPRPGQREQIAVAQVREKREPWEEGGRGKSKVWHTAVALQVPAARMNE